MIKTLIVEDQIQHSTYLQNELSKQSIPYTVCSVCSNVEDAVININLLKPDLVFLDIDLGANESGFDVLRQTSDLDYEVIFTTAFDKYAVQAIHFSFLSFILKPFSKDDLEKALDKYIKYRGVDTRTRKDVLLHNYIQTERRTLKIGIPSLTKSLEFVTLKDIIYCQATQNNTEFVLTDGSTKMFTKTLQTIEDYLFPNGFYRIHNSYLVNVDNVIAFQHTGSGSGEVTMCNRLELPVARNRKEGFLAYLDQVRGIIK
jgi:two-component system, LytTR family, response regulator